MKTECKKHGEEKTGESMDRVKAIAIVDRLLNSAAGLLFGSVSVTAKVHEGRVVGVVYSTTENLKEAEKEEEESETAKAEFGA